MTAQPNTPCGQKVRHPEYGLVRRWLVIDAGGAFYGDFDTEGEASQHAESLRPDVEIRVVESSPATSPNPPCGHPGHRRAVIPVTPHRHGPYRPYEDILGPQMGYRVFAANEGKIAVSEDEELVGVGAEIKAEIERRKEMCGATDGNGATCTLPLGHEGWHQDIRDGELFAGWRVDARDDGKRDQALADKRRKGET